MTQLMKGGEPFFFRGGDTGILLIHGFTGTPFEMRWLGEQLAARGHTVLGIRLFGHATRQEDMIRARFQDWVANVEDGYALLKQSCKAVYIGGLSMGAALSLHSAGELSWNGVFSMSAPIESPDARLATFRPVLPFVSKFWRFSAKGKPDWSDPSLANDHLDYPANPVRSGVELDLLLAKMRKNLLKIQIPALILHSRSDRVVSYRHAERIMHRLATQDKRLVLLEKSGHVITRDVEREQVLDEITAFLKHCGTGVTF
ncbi:MAG: alpha/beta fold hydrolase [Anaerolineales bacterium]|nr:alpha/beta fold hydrolase [Anaerolineales bacterium]